MTVESRPTFPPLKRAAHANTVALERLVFIGFRHCGCWSWEGTALACTLTSHSQDANVLYAFVVAGEVKYIGKTVQSLKRRMYGYQNPGPTQTTNIRSNKIIIDLVRRGEVVDVYSLPDNGLLFYGGFHVNLAAGLEDSLVRELKPDWNRTGK